MVSHDTDTMRLEWSMTKGERLEVNFLLSSTAANIDTGNLTMMMKGGGCWRSVKDHVGS